MVSVSTRLLEISGHGLSGLALGKDKPFSLSTNGGDAAVAVDGSSDPVWSNGRRRHAAGALSGSATWQGECQRSRRGPVIREVLQRSRGQAIKLSSIGCKVKAYIPWSEAWAKVGSNNPH